MSEPAANARRKVSREGVVLLKSFEGFRARAERDGDGWVIGYGHRKSAREGLTVGEADAELLLQYDLMPVVQALNALPVALNAHQFDALASFAFSVGVERFVASDVHARLAEGRPDAAAEALLAWSERAPAVAGLRRRAAERALFLADPQRPVALADLLSAPLPTSEPVPQSEARAAAVAALLGEATATADQATPQTHLDSPLVVPTFDAGSSGPKPAHASASASEPSPQREPAADSGVNAEPAPEVGPSGPIAAPVLAHWGTPYGVPVIGPLPGFPARAAATPTSPSTTPTPLPPLIQAAETPAAPTPEPEATPSSIPVAWPEQSPSSFPAPPVEALVLTPPPEVDLPVERPVWGDETRQPAAVDQTPLFVDAPSQVSILRHEEEPTAPHRFDWSETGMYVIMGGLGLVSCAVSAAAFRVAVEDPSPMGETTAVAWTLAVIGAVCVGAASWHLWVRTVGRKA